MLESIKKRVAGRKKSGKSLAGSGERRNFALAFGTEVPGRPAGRPRAAPGAAPRDGAGRDGREKIRRKIWRSRKTSVTLQSLSRRRARGLPGRE